LPYDAALGETILTHLEKALRIVDKLRGKS